MCVLTLWTEILQKIKCKFFKRLRNRGYEKKFLITLFRKVKFGSRNKLLAISEDNTDNLEIDIHRSDTVLINDAERMFQNIFSEVIVPMEINSQNIRTHSIDSHSSLLPVPKVCCCCSLSFFQKTKRKIFEKQKFPVVFLLSFQAEDSTERLNLIVPGSLLCFKEDIVKVFEKELNVLCKKRRFGNIFRNIQIKPVFKNRSNVKKLVVKTKLK